MHNISSDQSLAAVEWIEIYLAGTRRHNKSLRENLTRGISLKIQPEPDNPTDPHAILVFFEGEKFGYIDRESAQKIHQMKLNDYSFANEVFVSDRKGGPFHEGTLLIRATNVIRGWPLYNPTLDYHENKCAYENFILSTTLDSQVHFTSSSKKQKRL